MSLSPVAKNCISQALSTHPVHPTNQSLNECSISSSPPIYRSFQKFIEHFFHFEKLICKNYPAIDQFFNEDPPKIDQNSTITLPDEIVATLSNSERWQMLMESIPRAIRWKLFLSTTDLIENFLESILTLVFSVQDQRICNLLSGKKNARYEDALQEFILVFADFKKLGNPLKLNSYLNKCKEGLNLCDCLVEETNLNAFGKVPIVIDTILDITSCQNSHLLMSQSAPEFYAQRGPSDFPDFQLHTALMSLGYVSAAESKLIQLFKSLNKEFISKLAQDFNLDLNEVSLSSIQSKTFIGILPLIKEIYNGNVKLSKNYNLDIGRLYINLRKDFYRRGGNLSQNMFKLESIKDFSKERSIALLIGYFSFFKESALENLSGWGKEIENFIPRVKEYEEYLSEQYGSSLDRTLPEICDVLSYFILYLKFGNMEQLQVKLAQVKSSLHNFRNIVIDEVLKFSVNSKKDRNILQKIVEFLNSDEGKLLIEDRKMLGITKNYYSCIGNNLTLLHGPLSIAQSHCNTLFSYASSSQTQKTAKNVKIKNEFDSEGLDVEIDELDKDYSTDTDSKVAAEISSIRTRDSNQKLFVLLNHFQENLEKYFDSLISGCKGFESAIAVKNAKSHLYFLFSGLNRFFCRSENPISRAEIFSFITDSIVHGHLVVEQMLSALNRESNQFTTREELNEHLSHNFFEILINSKFKDKKFSCQTRRWILSINRGELLSRTIPVSSVNSNFIRQLLFKSWHYSVGNDAFSCRDIALDLNSYLKKLGTFCAEFSILFQQEKNKEIQEEIVNAIEVGFSDLAMRFKDRISSLKIEDTFISDPRLSKLFSELHSQLNFVHHWMPSEGLKSNFDNILKNQLVRLEYEIQMLEKLQPTEAALAYNNILLLNQQIMEQFLQNLIDAKAIIIEETTPHDLLQMLQTLEIDRNIFNQEELNFLSRGKETLFFCRYPDSYLSRYQVPIKKMAEILATMQEANKWIKKPFAEPLEATFSYPKKIQKGIDQVMRSIYDDLSLSISIQQKILSTLDIYTEATLK